MDRPNDSRLVVIGKVALAFLVLLLMIMLLLTFLSPLIIYLLLRWHFDFPQRWGGALDALGLYFALLIQLVLYSFSLYFVVPRILGSDVVSRKQP